MQNWMCELEKSTFLKEDPTSSRLLALLEENCSGKPRSFPTCQPGLLLALVLLKSAQFQDFSEGKFSFFPFSPSYIFCFFILKNIYSSILRVCMCVWCGGGVHMPGKAQRSKCPLCHSLCVHMYTWILAKDQLWNPASNSSCLQSSPTPYKQQFS